MSPAHPTPPATPSRLQQRIERITGEGFAFYEGHARAETRDALPHWIAALPALGKINADYNEKKNRKKKPLIDYLIKQLENPQESDWAVDTLGDMGQYAASALPALFDRLRDEELFVGCNTRESMGKIGQAIPEKVVPVLIERFNNKTETEWVRIDAAEVLRRIGKKANAAVPFFIGCLNDKTEHRRVREKSARVLGVVDEQTKCAVFTIIERLYDKTETEGFRMTVARVLGAIGRQASEAVIILTEWLNDINNDCYRRLISAVILSEIGEKANAVPFLIKCLHDRREDISLRLQAAEALVNFGETANVALPFLIECLKDKTKKDWVRDRSATALGKVGKVLPEKVIPILIERLKDKTDDKDTGVREKSATALGAIGWQASEAVPYLLRCLNDKTEEYGVRYSSATALGKFGERAGEAVPSLFKRFKDKTESQGFRSCVAGAFGEIQGKARLRIFLQDLPGSAADYIVYRAGELARGCRPFLPPPNPVPAVSPKLADLSDAELERELGGPETAARSG